MRQTGRTFRTVLAAALALSNGRDTMIVCRDDMMARYTMDKVRDVLHTFGIMDHDLLTHTRRTVTFMDTTIKAVTIYETNSPAFKRNRDIEVIHDDV